MRQTQPIPERNILQNFLIQMFFTKPLQSFSQTLFLSFFQTDLQIINRYSFFYKCLYKVILNLLDNKFLGGLIIRIPLFLWKYGFSIDKLIKELQIIALHNLSQLQLLIVPINWFFEVRNINFLELFFLNYVETRLFVDLLLQIWGKVLLNEFVDFVELFGERLLKLLVLIEGRF